MDNREWKTIITNDSQIIEVLESPMGCLVYHKRHEAMFEFFMPNLCTTDVRDLFFESGEPIDVAVEGLTPEQVDELQEILEQKVRSCIEWNCPEEADDCRKIIKNLGFESEV